MKMRNNEKLLQASEMWGLSKIWREHYLLYEIYLPCRFLARWLGLFFCSGDLLLRPRDFLAALVSPRSALFRFLSEVIHFVVLSFFISGLEGSTMITS